MNPEDALVAAFREMIRAKRRWLRLRVAWVSAVLLLLVAARSFLC